MLLFGSLAMVIAACSDGGDDATDAAAATADAAGASDEGGGEGDSDDATDAAVGGRASALTAGRETLPEVDSRVVRTADLRIEVEKGRFRDAFRDASELARSLGGFVQSSTTSSYERGEARGDVTLRVPVDRFDEAMRRLSELGEVESTSEEGEDVTAQLVDLDARIRALRAEEDALNALMAEATNVNEVLSVRSTSVGIRQEIEQLAAQQESLDDRAAFSTIHVLLHEPTAALSESSPDDDSWDLADAFGTAVDGAESVVGAMIVAVGLALPIAPLAAAAWALAHRLRRRAA